MKQPKRILVAPLNWGLGHVTRCMPIIDECIRQGAEVWLASDGRAYHLLKKEYPQLPLLQLPAYNIRYGNSSMVVNMALQMPKILWVMRQEQQVLQKYIKKHQIDAVISDNRFGCFSASVPCVFLSHQIHLKIPALMGLGTFAKWNNRRLIQRYYECWVPDFEDEPNLSGSLSHGKKLANMRFIGPLSRMKPSPANKKYDVIAVLSGPEPQRSYFEDIILKQAQQLPHSFLVVKGKTDSETQTKNNNIEIVSYMIGHELNKAILSSDIILCRSGYSTLMDLAILGKKNVILVPTPGQTEQEYLAKTFSDKKIFLVENQNTLNLERALWKVKAYSGLEIRQNHQALQTAIQALLSIL